MILGLMKSALPESWPWQSYCQILQLPASCVVERAAGDRCEKMTSEAKVLCGWRVDHIFLLSVASKPGGDGFVTRILQDSTVPAELEELFGEVPCWVCRYSGARELVPAIALSAQNPPPLIAS